MVLVVAPALIPDIPKIYDIYFKAFEQDEMGRLIMGILFPQGITEEFKKAHAAATLEFWHASDSQFTFKCIDTDLDGEIIGMGLGDYVIKHRAPEERVNPGVQWLEGEERERAEKILNPLWETRDELIGGQPHIYCHVIAVDPKHQGRKAGALLCQYGIEQSERTQVPLYFESSPTTLGLYQKIGFELLERTVVHKAEDLGTPEDVTVPLMVRMPSSADGMKFQEWREKGYPKFEGKPLNLSLLTAAGVAAAGPGSEKLLGLLDQLTKACGGEKNLMSLASMATAIGVDKLPQLLALMGIESPAPAPAPTPAPAPAQEPETAPEPEAVVEPTVVAEPTVVETPVTVKPTSTTVETTVEIAQH